MQIKLPFTRQVLQFLKLGNGLLHRASTPEIFARIMAVVEIFAVSDVSFVLRFSLLPVSLATWERRGV